jgi:hypothetical protein
MTVAEDLEILRNTIGSASGTTHGRMESALDAIHRLISALAETTATELTSTDNAIARFDGTEGALQDSAASVNNSGDITGRNLVATVSVFTGNDFSFDEESDSPQLNQVASAVDSATGYHMIVKAQSCTGATSTGGDLRLKGGTGTSANGATQILDTSNNPVVEVGGTDETLGFYGETPTAKPEITGETSDPVAISIAAALATLGLATDSHTEP